MRALVVFGSKRGGTAGLAQMISDALVSDGIETDLYDATDAPSPASHDAVIVAGAVYMTRWHRQARRYVRRYASELRGRQVWLVSSGPLDDTADERELPPVPQVAKLVALVGARGQVSFGGRLAPDATGFAARAMAKRRAGDWRDPEHVRQFAATVAAEMAAVQAASP